MKNLKKYNWRNFLPIIFFVGVIIAISYKLLPQFGILTYGDYVYLWPQSSFSDYSTWQTSFMGIPWVVNMFGVPITGLLPLFLTRIGFSNAVTAYLLSYIPVLITCLLTFSIIKKISGNIYYAYFAGLFIIVNNFILEQFILWPGHYFWNVIGLLILFYQTIIIYNKNFSLRNSMFIIFSSLFMLQPFLWMLYLSYFFFFGVFLLITKWSKKSFLYVLITFIGIVLIHSYWLIPFLYNLTIQSAIKTYNGNQLAVFIGYKSIAQYIHLFNLYSYPGFESKPNIHNSLQMLFNYLFLSLLMISIIVTRKSKLLLFFVFIYIIYFNLALGPNSFFTGKLWLWSFQHIPGLGFFRSFTRFLQISLLALIVIGALTIKDVKFKYKNTIIVSLTVFLILANGIYFTGDLNGTQVAAKVPQEYYLLNEKYFNTDDNGSYTILSYPNISYESNTWDINRNTKSFAQITYFKEYFFAKPVAFNMYATNLDKQNNTFSKMFALNNNFVFPKDFDTTVSEMNIKYILIQKDLIDVDHLNDTVDYSKYIHYFDVDKNYIKKEDNAYFTLYENEKYLPLIVSKNSLFQSLSPTKYIIAINHLKNTQQLVFLQSFNNQWKLYLMQNPKQLSCKRTVNDPYLNENECKSSNTFFEGDELGYFTKKPLFETTHKIAYGYANSWEIDGQYIKRNFPNNFYTTNSDGTINIEVTLFFRPQSFFILGTVITVSIIILCLFALAINYYIGRDSTRVKRFFNLRN